MPRGEKSRTSPVTVTKVGPESPRRRRGQKRVWAFADLIPVLAEDALKRAEGDRSRIRVLGRAAYEVDL